MERDVVVNVANKVTVHRGIPMELDDTTQFKMGGTLKETMENLLDAISEQTDASNAGVPKEALAQISAQAEMAVENKGVSIK